LLNQDLEVNLELILVNLEHTLELILVNLDTHQLLRQEERKTRTRKIRKERTETKDKRN